MLAELEGARRGVAGKIFPARLHAGAGDDAGGLKGRMI